MSEKKVEYWSAERSAEVRDSFARQEAMHLIQASMPVLEKGEVEIHMPHWKGVGQQHGFVHGGVVGMIADSAGGYAAMTVAPPGTSVLTVEYKLNFLAPAKGDKLIARGAVIKAGRRLIVTEARVWACEGSRETLCAVMQQTIMAIKEPEQKSGEHDK